MDLEHRPALGQGYAGRLVREDEGWGEGGALEGVIVSDLGHGISSLIYFPIIGNFNMVVNVQVAYYRKKLIFKRTFLL